MSNYISLRIGNIQTNFWLDGAGFEFDNYLSKLAAQRCDSVVFGGYQRSKFSIRNGFLYPGFVHVQRPSSLSIGNGAGDIQHHLVP